MWTAPVIGGPPIVNTEIGEGPLVSGLFTGAVVTLTVFQPKAGESFCTYGIRYQDELGYNATYYPFPAVPAQGALGVAIEQGQPLNFGGGAGDQFSTEVQLPGFLALGSGNTPEGPNAKTGYYATTPIDANMFAAQADSKAKLGEATFKYFLKAR